MKNHGAEDLLDPMFEMGQETMDLSIEAKMEYWQGNSGGSFGYVAVAVKESFGIERR